MDVRTAPAPIPMGCICAYTWAWSPVATQLVRNGPLKACTADHAAVDGR